MFGRLLSVEIFNKEGESTFLVDRTHGSSLACSGTIEYLPASSGAPKATIEVYNVPAALSTILFSTNSQVAAVDGSVEDPDLRMVRVRFGYEDENEGKLSTIFVGRIARAFTTREDATTSITRIYAYQIQNFFNTAVSSVFLRKDVTTLYDGVVAMIEHSTLSDIEIDIPEALKGFVIDTNWSFYGKTVDGITALISKANYLLSTTPTGLYIVPSKPTDAGLGAVVLADYDESGKIVSQSGLIGYPSIDTDGMRFKTLINPQITLYSYVWLPNTAIIDQRTGFLPSTQFGAAYDPAGLYRIVKMTTRFDSYEGDCSTSYVAIMAGTSSQYYK